MMLSISFNTELMGSGAEAAIGKLLTDIAGLIETGRLMFRMCKVFTYPSTN
jgi:hypothetical protein